VIHPGANGTEDSLYLFQSSSTDSLQE